VEAISTLGIPLYFASVRRSVRLPPRHQTQQVARMERSEIQERLCRVAADPDFTAFHPGYERHVSIDISL
jgi:hypothetical protein